MSEQILHLPVVKIIPGDNDRTTFDETALRELAGSIAANGLAQPITVRPVYFCQRCRQARWPRPQTCPHCGGSQQDLQRRYQIVAGERRYRAISQVLRRDTAPCLVRELDDEEASAIMLAENTDRVDLNPIEEAHAYHKRSERFGWDVARIAQTAGVSMRQVYARIALLDLTPNIQHLVAAGQLPLAHAETMARLDPDRQRLALRVVTQSETSPDIVMFRRLCSRLYAEQQQDAMFDLAAYTAQVQRLVAQASKPRSGKDADTSHIPTRPDLPDIAYNRKDTIAVIIERWLAQLQEQGHAAEAGAVGSLYTTLVHARLVKLPYETGLIAA